MSLYFSLVGALSQELQGLLSDLSCLQAGRLLSVMKTTTTSLARDLLIQMTLSTCKHCLRVSSKTGQRKCA